MQALTGRFRYEISEIGDMFSSLMEKNIVYKILDEDLTFIVLKSGVGNYIKIKLKYILYEQ